MRGDRNLIVTCGPHCNVNVNVYRAGVVCCRDGRSKLFCAVIKEHDAIRVHFKGQVAEEGLAGIIELDPVSIGTRVRVVVSRGACLLVPSTQVARTQSRHKKNVHTILF